MAKEKQKATDTIIALIQSHTDAIIQSAHDEKLKTLKEAIEDDNQHLYKEFETQLEDYNIELEQKLKQFKSSLRYQGMVEMLDFRQSLVDALETSLKASIQDYRSTQDYQMYLEACINSIDFYDVIYLDTMDLDKIQNSKVQVKPLRLGGVIIESDQKIYDFSLEHRLKLSLDSLLHMESLQLKGDAHE